MKRDHLVIVDYGFRSAGWLGKLFTKVELFKYIAQIQKNTVVVLEGGTDISPRWYDEKPGSYTQDTDTGRDRLEKMIYDRAMRIGAAVLGVCRGAQFVTALNGGKLIQHVENHIGTHDMVTDEGKIIATTSHHHQMMFPYNLPSIRYEIKAWCPKPLSNVYLNGDDRNGYIPDVESEVIWYPFTKSLAVQGHPEWADIHGPYVGYCSKLVNDLLINDNKGAD